MKFNKQWKLGVVSLAAVMVLGVSATAYAQAISETSAEGAPVVGEWFGRGMGRGLMREHDQGAKLAEVLGISVEELQAAQTEARNAAIDQAVVDGQITQEQADTMKANEDGFGRGFGRDFGRMAGGSNHKALFAEALGITVEELQSAQEEVKDSLIAEAVAAGTITQEEADLMEARHDLQTYLRDTLQDAYEAGVQQAVTDGVITQAQADQILSEGEGGLFGRGGHHGGPGGFGGPGIHRGGERGGFPNSVPTQPEDEKPDESSGIVVPQPNVNL
jgi:hypothetical protein